MIKDLWYKNAVIYCLSVGTYMDANGDGIGDFQGLMRRLDYLQGLGVTALWLMPFQTSPGRDDRYDVSDYYGVNPAYGTLGDFVEFTHAASQRGIRVIIDLVLFFVNPPCGSRYSQAPQPPTKGRGHTARAFGSLLACSTVSA
jgi:maltose alpha-D-glucosyltransferase/alpha-amylase